MTDSINAFVTGDRELSLVFEKLPDELHQSLRDRISGTIIPELAARVRAAVPKGKTGKLASEIAEKTIDTPEKITGVVYVSGEFAKAAALEYGAHGVAHVRTHWMKLTHAWARAIGLPKLIDMHAYDRHVNIAERNYLRGPEAALAGEVQAQLEDAVNTALARV